MNKLIDTSNEKRSDENKSDSTYQQYVNNSHLVEKAESENDLIALHFEVEKFTFY